MAKKATEPLESHHIKLFVGDFDELDRLLAGRVSPSVAIRTLVRNFINKTKDRAQQSFKPLEVDVDAITDTADRPEQPGSDLQQEPSGVE